MLKPASLRARLLEALPELERDPDKLVVIARGGRLVTTGTGSLSFEYAYTVQAVVLDFANHADAIMVPVLAWVQEHQPEIFDNPTLRESAIRFEVEYTNGATVDVSVEIDLTERVLVKPRAGQPGAFDIKHVPEPEHPGRVPFAEHWSLWLRDELLAEWDRDPR